MDMVNDGKDIHLDTPQAVKEALASGKDLYNPQTGEFWWEYNYTGSIANTYVHLDDPNLLAVIDNPDFDLYEDIVGGLNYTGYITDSIETIIEDGEENAPLIDPRDEVFAQIASEDGWVIASPENVRAAESSSWRTAMMRRPGTGVTAPTTIPSPARRQTLRAAPSPTPVRRSSALTSGTAPTSNPPLRTPVSK